MKWDNVKQRACLTDDTADGLSELGRWLPSIAELMSADLFIDCLDRQSGLLFVAAQAFPSAGQSVYSGSVDGCTAQRESEPAAYWAMETGVPVRDLKAVTQENRVVRQNVIPLRDNAGTVCAVLIAEQDVSRGYHMEQKYRALSQSSAGPAEGSADLGLLRQREIHHRIKNHLQTMASIMNLQMRQAAHPEARQAFQENRARVLSIAAIEDILLAQPSGMVSLRGLADRLCRNIQTVFGDSGAEIEYTVSGGDAQLPQGQASDVAIVINELLTNAYKHAFRGRPAGHIGLLIQRTGAFVTVAVRDDGIGFPPEGCREGLGLSIVRMTVQEKLGGELHIAGNPGGCIISFDFSAAGCYDEPIKE